MDGCASSQGANASSTAASQMLAATAPRADRRPEVVAVARRGQVRRRVVGAAGQLPRHAREDLARSHVAVRDEAPAAFSARADLDGRVAAVFESQCAALRTRRLASRCSEQPRQAAH